jgi:citrate synthase
VLLYRGYPIEQLAEQGDFLETCYLLLYGELPTAKRRRPISTTASRATPWCTSRCRASSAASAATRIRWRSWRRGRRLSAFYHDSTDINDPLPAHDRLATA